MNLGSSDGTMYNSSYPHDFAEESDDDPSNWIPLEEENINDSNQNQNPEDTQKDSTLNGLVKKEIISTSSTRASTSASSKHLPKEKDVSIDDIQIRLETRVKLREGLVSHPLKSFGMIFWKHVLNELWRENMKIRFGLICIMIGIFLHLLRSIFQIKVFFYASLLVISVGFFFRWDRHLTSSMFDLEFINTLMEDTRLFRAIFFCFYFIPTFVEVQTYIFFTRTIIYQSGKHKYSILLVILLIQSYFLYHLKKRSKLSLKKCNRYGRIMLQTLAFILSLRDWRNFHLGGPFFFILGGYLLSSVREDENGEEMDEMEWANRVFRHCLRLTLRDVLSTLGENVAEDEMLQLAMLRWIADYWAFKKNNTAPTSTSTPHVPSSTQKSSAQKSSTQTSKTSSDRTSSTPSISVASKSEEKQDNVEDTSNTWVRSSTSLSKTAIPSSSAPYFSEHQREDLSASNLTWEDLFQMLSTTTGLMENEVHLDSSNFAFTQSRPTMQNPDSKSGDSIENLRSLLSSIDIDDRAKPVIQAYKKAIHSFPPSNEVCELFSLLKKCPASIAGLLLQCYGGEQLFLESLILIPSIYIEIIRLLDWKDSIGLLYCNPNQSDNHSNLYGMTLLFTAHTDFPHRIIPNQPPALLQVWHNILISVSVFEQGLQGVKCAQTSLVAKDFCDNVVSLAGLGMQVYNKGWIYGVGVIAKEVLSNESSVRHEGGSIDIRNGRYVKDAIGIVNNGGYVIKNLSELLDEQDGELSPIVNGFLTVMGKGWIWGNNKVERDEDNCDDIKKSNLNASSGQNGGEERSSMTNLLNDAIKETMELNKTVKDLDDLTEERDSCMTAERTLSTKKKKAEHSMSSLLSDAIEETMKLSEKKNSIDKQNEDITENITSFPRQNNSAEVVKNVEENEDDLAGLLELLLKALENDVITESEKDNMIEIALHAKNQEKSKRNRIIEKMKSSLEISLKKNIEIVNDGKELIKEKKGTEKCIVTDECRKKEKVVGEKNASAHLSIEEQAQIAIEQRSDKIRSNNQTDETITLMSEIEKEKPQKLIKSYEDKDKINFENKPGDNDHNDDDYEEEEEEEEGWTAIPADSIPSEQTQQTSVSQATYLKSDGKDEEEIKNNENDNFIKIIGGGLTVLGAVVGGLAMLGGNKNEKESESSSGSTSSQKVWHYNSSRVTIEELGENKEK